jgi:LemA protein
MTVIVPLLILAVILLGVPLWVISVYNRLVSTRNLVDNAWAQTDTQLKRRCDLIPNLVETVKGYATHERQTFENVIQARNTAVNAVGPQARDKAENVLTGALKSVFAIAEAYPELKANQGFLSLQTELTKTEGYIAQCRSNYNDAVLTLNNALQVFPANTVASLFKFQSREFFGVPPGTDREAPKVQF